MCTKAYVEAHGITIVEFVVAVAIVSIVGLAAFVFQRDIFSLHRVASETLIAEQGARRAFRMLTAELRSASPSSSGSYPLVTADATTLTFYSDIDNDGLKERVRYFLSGTKFQKGMIRPTGTPSVYNLGSEVVATVVSDVANAATPVFEYFDENYAGTSTPLSQPVNILKVRLVKATIVIDHDSSRPPAPLTVTTQVSIRNLKGNL